ncbi:MAG: hypothetical protein HWN81_13975 [Candidatus Lokiarchaeota archaeon]|nr:hypothetical protein [Candidatus Lokiarchaeota archaeon]
MKIAVIIQGSLINFTNLLDINLTSLKEYINPRDIYISTWKKDLESKKDTTVSAKLSEIKLKHDVNIILNDDPVTRDEVKIINNNNFVRQSCSSYYGINYALRRKDYDYIIKLRTDSALHGYDYLLNKINEEQNKILCSSFFFRKDIAYHPGDHIIAGKSNEIYDLFRIQFDKTNRCRNEFKDAIKYGLDKRYLHAMYENEELASKLIQQNVSNTPPEIKFCVDYLINKLNRKVYKKESHILMKEYFSPIDLEGFNNYYVNSNKMKYYFHKREITEKYNGDIFDFINQELERTCNCYGIHICEHVARWAIIKILLENIVINSKDIVPIENDDLTTFCSFMKPYTLLEETKNLVKFGV